MRVEAPTMRLAPAIAGLHKLWRQRTADREREKLFGGVAPTWGSDALVELRLTSPLQQGHDLIETCAVVDRILGISN